MSAVDKALWFIESHFAEDVSLAEVAAVAGVSRHHLVRAFGAATGMPVMRYVRGRRLSEAARALAAGAPDILAVALDAGYGSHEAFTRAFRDRFGATPETVRAEGRFDRQALVEPVRIRAPPVVELPPPRIEEGGPLLVAGLEWRYEGESRAGIPAQWQSFQPHIEALADRVGRDSFGVCRCADGDGIDYLAGVRLRGGDDLPADLVRVRVPAHRYAVFRLPGHVSTIARAWAAIFLDWLPQSGWQVADVPDFERYDEAFDPCDGTGGYEIWVPVDG